MARKSLHVRIAEELIKTHDITPEMVWKEWTRHLPQHTVLYDFDLSDELWKILMRKVRSLNYYALAALIWHSKSVNLYRVHSSEWLGRQDSGRTLMRTIGATILASTIMDLVPKPARELAAAA